MNTRIRLGIDLGGTKIEIVALDASGAERFRHRAPTPQGDYEATLDAIAALVRNTERSLGVPPGSCTIGVGTPGSLSVATGLLRNSNSVCLNGRPFKRDLELRVAREIRVSNDANCFAVSEAQDGAAAGAHVVFGVILGTGVGGGIVIDGVALDGRNGIAGEWGHNPLPWMTTDEFPGEACYCGKRGCIESFLSGPAFERRYEAKTHVKRSAPEIADAAAAGDEKAIADVAWYHDGLARALASIINVVDPDVVVLGGGMSNLARLAEAVAVRLPEYVFSDSVVTRVVKNVHGDSSGVRGAAWLWSVEEAQASAV